MKTLFCLLCVFCGSVLFGQTPVDAGAARIAKARADEQARIARHKAELAERYGDAAKDAEHQVEFIVHGRTNEVYLSVTPSIENRSSFKIQPRGEWSQSFTAKPGASLLLMGELGSIGAETDFVIRIDGVEVARNTVGNPHERGGVAVVLNDDGSATAQPLPAVEPYRRKGQSQATAVTATGNSTTNEPGDTTGSGRLVSETHSDGWVGTRDSDPRNTVTVISQDPDFKTE